MKRQALVRSDLSRLRLRTGAALGQWLMDGWTRARSEDLAPLICAGASIFKPILVRR